MTRNALLFACLAASTGLLFAACGADEPDDTKDPTSTALGGTAATGAPMAGASVNLRCRNGGTAATTTDDRGEYSVDVPTANLPCGISATPKGGGQSQFSVTSGSGSPLVANISPLTTLAIAATGVVPDDAWFAALDDAGLLALASGMGAGIDALNEALAGYALPPDFNPITSPLAAATSGQAGNEHDRLLEQLQAALDASADSSFEHLLASVAGGTLDLPAAPRTPGATHLAAFFTTFSGEYTLTVTNVASEGASAGAAQLLPLNSARAVRIESDGDVTIEAVGTTFTYAAADFDRDFIGTADSQNEVRYRTKDARQWLELYIAYAPASGVLSLDLSGFLSNDEGLATLQGGIYVPTSSAQPTETCTAGDDRLVITNGPEGFCGFTRSASASAIPHYVQFTSAAGAQGVTWVKFDLNGDDTAVEKVTIENDAYAFGCGGALTACAGVTVTTGATFRQFTLTNTSLAVINGATQPITVSGLLIHPQTSDGGDGDPLAQRLSAPFAGTYLLNCYSDGSSSPFVERTVVVREDGTSTLDGHDVIATGHGGTISYTLSASGPRTYSATYAPTDPQKISFELKFKADGSLTTDSNRSHSAYVDGKGGTCVGISGPAVGSAAIGRAELPALIGGNAQTGTLKCSGATEPPLPSGTTTVSIESDGTLRAGTFSITPAQYTAEGKAFTIQDGVTFPSSGFMTPAAISFRVGGEYPDEAGGTTTGSFFFRFDTDRKPTLVQATLNPSTATCMP